MQGILLKGDRQTVFRMEDAVHKKIVTSYLKRNDKRGLQKQEKTREHSGRKRGKHLTCTAVGILFMASYGLTYCAGQPHKSEMSDVFFREEQTGHPSPNPSSNGRKVTPRWFFRQKFSCFFVQRRTKLKKRP